MHATPWEDERRAGDERNRLESGMHEVDVCVIGAGIAGLTTAYLLSRAGRSVLVLEAGEFARGETARTSAHLASALDDRFTELERTHGADGARLAAGSHAAAIDLIERIVAEHGIDCDFARLDGFLISADGDAAALEGELAAARRAGLAVEAVVSVPGLEGWSGPALRFRRQGRFQPLAYLQGLAACCLRAGVRIVTGTRAMRIADGEPVTVETADGGIVRCGAAVVATNVPINDRVVLQTKLEAYRTYVVTARVPHGSVPDLLLWDDGDPYHYVRIVREAAGDLLIVGGEDHKTGQGPEDPQQPQRRLEEWLRHRFPAAGPLVHAWSGQIIEPVDGLAYIGRNPGDRHVHVITGDSGNGLTHGTLGGMLIADLIQGRPNPWEALYQPSRISLRTAGAYAGHNTNVLAQYGDWLKADAVASPDDIPVGSGTIMRQGLQPVAVHRDAEGRLHQCSAVCPHLGGVVRWNPTELTWDCPCHGSRFTATGAVLNGPANTGLAPIADSTAPTSAQGVLA